MWQALNQTNDDKYMVPTLLEYLVQHMKAQVLFHKHSPTAPKNALKYVTGYIKPKSNLYPYINLFVSKFVGTQIFPESP